VLYLDAMQALALLPQAQPLRQVQLGLGWAITACPSDLALYLIAGVTMKKIYCLGFLTISSVLLTSCFGMGERGYRDEIEEPVEVEDEYLEPSYQYTLTKATWQVCCKICKRTSDMTHIVVDTEQQAVTCNCKGGLMYRVQALSK
jgi:hypothetical protein